MPTSLLPCHLYCLEFPNSKTYIGLTTRPVRRQACHRATAKAGSTLPVHKAIRKYGFPPFRILCTGTREYIADLEVRLIAALQTRNPQYGYNVFVGGDLGTAMSPEVSAKISAANKGRLKGIKHPPEFGAKISATKKGQKPSSESIAKMKATKTGKPAHNKGIPFSLEARANMKAAQRKRLPTSYASGAKMSAALSGIPKPPFSVEHRAQIAAARRGKKCPEVAAANRRRRGLPKPPFTPEHCANIAAARRRYSAQSRNKEKNS